MLPWKDLEEKKNLELKICNEIILGSEKTTSPNIFEAYRQTLKSSNQGFI